VKKKRRKIGFFDDLFEDFIEEIESFFSQDFGGVSGGYSVSVYQTPEGTIVEAHISDDADADSFRRILEEQYPEAKIIIKGGKKSKLIKRESETEEKKVTIKLTEEEETTKESSVSERDELSYLLSGGKKRVFIEREEN